MGAFSTRLGKLLMFGLCIFFLVGCAVGGSARLKPNSHFAYPNSNVKPLGPVIGSASTASIMVPTMISGAMMESAYKDALSKSGGDMIIDAVETSTTRMIMTPIGISFYFTSFDVEGTAAKMELGKQILK